MSVGPSSHGVDWPGPWLTQSKKLVKERVLLDARNSLWELDDALDERVYAAREKATGPEVGFPKFICACVCSRLGDVLWIGDRRILVQVNIM